MNRSIWLPLSLLMSLACSGLLNADVDSPSGVSFQMVRIHGGHFMMGTTDGAIDERPVRRVEVSAYSMMETEVTQKLWFSVMGHNPSRFARCGEDCPVDSVSWMDAIRFANKLSEHAGLEPCYQISEQTVHWSAGLSCEGYRLPTEAEWEYAARAGQDDLFAGSNNIGEVAWYNGNSERQTHPVGKKKPNHWGLYDLSGNVAEWCWDRAGTYPASPGVNPNGPDHGAYRILRGSSSEDNPSSARVTNRSRSAPIYTSSTSGLRLVRP